jgi:hypothetical protein
MPPGIHPMEDGMDSFEVRGPFRLMKSADRISLRQADWLTWSVRQNFFAQDHEIIRAGVAVGLHQVVQKPVSLQDFHFNHPAGFGPIKEDFCQLRVIRCYLTCASAVKSRMRMPEIAIRLE